MSKTNFGEFPLPYGLACDLRELSIFDIPPATHKSVRSNKKRSINLFQPEQELLEAILSTIFSYTLNLRAYP